MRALSGSCSWLVVVTTASVDIDAQPGKARDRDVPPGPWAWRYRFGMVRPSRPTPRQLVDPWPGGEAQDASAAVAGGLAVALREAMAGRSTRTVRELTGVDHTTVGAILNGTTWPDLATVARLEHGLGVDLWPGGVAREFES